jgi:hypothetical protein
MPINIELTEAEALVLFDWLCEFDSGGMDSLHPAERRVLWNIQCDLEKILVEPFKPEYDKLLEQARAEVGE